MIFKIIRAVIIYISKELKIFLTIMKILKLEEENHTTIQPIILIWPILNKENFNQILNFNTNRLNKNIILMIKKILLIQ